MKASNQHATQTSAGGNQVGGNGIKARLHKAPAFNGSSGQPNNQSTSRGKGRT